MRGMTLGQFYPADSVLHRMDPRFKIICSIAYIVASFLCKNFFSFVLLVVSAVALILLSRIPLRVVLRSVRPLIFIMAFTAVLNIFWVTDAGSEPLFQWRFIAVYEKGLYQALFILLRIVAMIIGTSIFLTYTTTPIALTDAIERLLYPLSRLHVPVHTFAMMMTIALRFIPTIVDETDKIMSAQKARGADFTTGSLVSRAKALIPVIVPLFASAFRRADELATAMECRCYHGGEGRTRLRVLKCHARDFLVLLAVAVLIAGIAVINAEGAVNGWIYTM
jgi:energy-coupling factor transport system permease protein